MACREVWAVLDREVAPGRVVSERVGLSGMHWRGAYRIWDGSSGRTRKEQIRLVRMAVRRYGVSSRGLWAVRGDKSVET
jgi:hypothetical protein